jgi:hypothetical protein
MAIGTKTDFKIYDEMFWGGVTETLQQNTDVFNQASAGAIRLVPRAIRGDFERESFMKELTSGLLTYRDVTAVTAVTDVKLSQDEIVGVKVNRRIGPVAETLDAFRKIGSTPEEFSFILGQQYGRAIQGDYVDTALTVLNAAISGQSAVNYSIVANTPATLNYSDMIKALSTFGDAQQRIAAFAMHSKPFHDLMGQGVADKVPGVYDAVIYGGTVATLGRPVIVTDSVALVNLNGSLPPTYNILGLVDGAIEVAESEERDIVSQLITGLQNLVMRIQGEYAFNLRVKGFTWDVTNGGANPNQASLAGATNWDRVATSTKNLAGIRILTK